MRLNILHNVVLAILLLSASVCVGADSKPAVPSESAGMSKAPDKAQRGKKAAVAVKAVDINSATKAELQKLPGITATEADKIIAGRPYGSKAWLVTRNIISGAHYAQIKDSIIARQK